MYSEQKANAKATLLCDGILIARFIFSEALFTHTGTEIQPVEFQYKAGHLLCRQSHIRILSSYLC